MKKCKKCGKEYPATDEYFRSCRNRKGEKKWLSNECKECDNRYSREYSKKNQPHKWKHVRAYHKRYREEHKSEIRNKYYKRVFGITEDEFRAMVKRQKNSCAVCKEPIDMEDKYSFNIDHCHDTGKVRGILCSKCNRGIGFFNNSEQRLLSAARYLLNPNPLPCFNNGEGTPRRPK